MMKAIKNFMNKPITYGAYFKYCAACASISWAQIKLPDGTIIQGKVDNWTDYEGDQLQITIDGTTYLVHAANAIMKT